MNKQDEFLKELKALMVKYDVCVYEGYDLMPAISLVSRDGKNRDISVHSSDLEDLNGYVC